MHHINQKWAMGKSAHWVPIAHLLHENEGKIFFSVTKIAPPP